MAMMEPGCRAMSHNYITEKKFVARYVRSIGLLNFAVISCFKKIFDVSCTDTAVECMKMFDCCEVSDVTGRRKLKFLQRYAWSDSIVCLACKRHKLIRVYTIQTYVCYTSHRATAIG